MKKLAIILLVASCMSLTACNKGQQINGHTMQTAMRSIKGLKNRLPAEKRMEFEVAFWTIREATKEDKTFLNLVDGKKPEELIEMGKQIYQQRKASGEASYQQYSSWEEMITKFGRERIDQDNKAPKKKEDDKDKANDVLYKLQP
jgi:hypothetical protein